MNATKKNEDILRMAREARDSCQAIVDELFPDPFRSSIPGMEDFLISLTQATDENGRRVILTPRDLLPHMDEIIKLAVKREAERGE